ncbi:MAG: hypothetical protein CR974_00620 [Gammaproteobacteria bacterium]|nr:MAG: hypothetical protein CR974_00620 [Gammaproteobacteria bacterium]
MRYSLVDRTLVKRSDLAKLLTQQSARFSTHESQKLKTLTYNPNNGKLYVRADIIFKQQGKEEVDEKDIYIIPEITCATCDDASYSSIHQYTYGGETSGHHGHWSVPFAERNAEWLADLGEAEMPINYTYSYFAHSKKSQVLDLYLVGNITQAGLDKYRVLLTTYYANEALTNEAPYYLVSSQHLIIYQSIAIGFVLITFIFQYISRRRFGNKKDIVVGILLLVFSLLNIEFWYMNYMVIGMGIIAVSAVLLVFSSDVYMLFYLLGTLFISDVSHLQYGSSKAFLFHTILLYSIGFLLFHMTHVKKAGPVKWLG